MTPSPSPADLPLLGIEMPDPVGWWPLAWGWWVIIALVLLGLVGVGVWLYRHHRRRIPIDFALNELGQIEQRYAQDNRRLVQEVSMLLRRVAMNQYGRADTAGLVGSQWSGFLQSKGMSLDLAKALSEMPYRPIETVEVDKLLQQVRGWIKTQAKPIDAKQSISSSAEVPHV